MTKNGETYTDLVTHRGSWRVLTFFFKQETLSGEPLRLC